MSKINHIIKKNLLLLTRSKTTAFVIFFGPLFIIMLIELTFTNTASSSIHIGYINPEPSELADQFINNLQEKGFIAEEEPNNISCIENVKLGTQQTCIIFPRAFTLKNNKTNKITFYVDQSRTNFVHQIIESISQNLGLASKELSKELTNTLINTLQMTKNDLSEGAGDIVKIKSNLNMLNKITEESSTEAKNIDYQTIKADPDTTQGYYDTLERSMEDLRDDTTTFLNLAKDLRDDLAGNTSETYTAFADGIDNLENALSDNENEQAITNEQFKNALDKLIDAINNANNKLTSAKNKNDELLKKLTDAKEQGEKIAKNLDRLKARLEQAKKRIDDLSITSSETITNPITTHIEYTSSKNDKLTFMFPYLLMLVVMFIGLLLSGTLIVMETKSKSSFRTFCTPIKDETLIVGNFFTSFIVVAIQVSIIIGIASYLLQGTILTNIAVASTILFLGIVFFIILGMTLGYLLNSQEGVTMIAISLGSISLFLSNLILPLETLGEQLKKLISYNPYVITSEALRKAILFNTPFQHLQKELQSMIIYSISVFLILILIKKILKSKWYMNKSITRRKNIFDDPSDLYINVKGENIKSLRAFQEWLERVSDATFERELSWKEIREWMKRNHLSTWLRIRIAGKKRKDMARIIKKYLDRREKP